jgi:hypothetical protein
MDGYLISFEIDVENFDKLIRAQMAEHYFTNTTFLRNQSLPKSWPANIPGISSALHKKFDHHDVWIHYEPTTETAYGTILYDQW